jgi:hypothetical protein
MGSRNMRLMCYKSPWGATGLPQIDLGFDGERRSQWAQSNRSRPVPNWRWESRSIISRTDTLK